MKLRKKKEQIAETMNIDADIDISDSTTDATGIEVDPELEVVELEPKKKDPLKQRKKKKIIKRCILAGVLVIILVIIVVGNANAKNAIPMVGVSALEMGDVEETVKASGFVTSEESKTYFAPADVTLGEFALKVGDQVKANDRLIAFDTSDLVIETEKAELAAVSADEGYQQSLYESSKAQNDYAIAKANVDTYKLLIVLQRNYINDINAAITGKTNSLAQSAQCIKDGIAKQVNSKNDELTNKSKELNEISINASGTPSDPDRYTRLKNEILDIQNEISKLSSSEAHVFYTVDTIAESRQLADAQNLLSDMQSYLAKDESKMEAAQQAVLDAHAKEKLKADNEIQQISADYAQSELSEASQGVYADFNGVISELSVVSGSPVTKGGQLLTLQSIEDVMVNVAISKYNLAKVAIGQKADITIAGKTYDGTVSRINAIATKNESGTPVITADVHIDNPDEFVYLGVEAKVVIHTASAKNVLLAPVETVNEDNDGQFCYIIKDNVLKRKSVTTGVSSDTMIEIVDGLNIDDQVVNDYSVTLTDGMAATALPPVPSDDETKDTSDKPASEDTEDSSDKDTQSEGEETADEEETADGSATITAGASAVTEGE